MDQDVERLLAVMEAISRGQHTGEIMEFTQTWQDPLVRRIAESMGMMMVKVEAREFRLEKMITELEELNARVKTNALETVTTVANILAARDSNTAGHARRVAAYARRLARLAGLGEEEIEAISLAGMLHDIGKIGFSDKMFLNEDTRLSDEMLDEVTSHPLVGAEILAGLNFLGPAVNFVRWHHERLDGLGYPDGLSGGDIPPGARILAVVDSFDAMTTARPYQPKMEPDKAFEILRHLARNALDPDLVEKFILEIQENGLEEDQADGS